MSLHDHLSAAYVYPSKHASREIQSVVAESGAAGCIDVHKSNATIQNRFSLAEYLDSVDVHALEYEKLWSPFFSRPRVIQTLDQTDQDPLILQLLSFLATSTTVKLPIRFEVSEATSVLIGSELLPSVQVIEVLPNTGETLFHFPDGLHRRVPTVSVCDEFPEFPVKILWSEHLPSAWKRLLPIERRGLNIASKTSASSIVPEAFKLLEQLPEYLSWITSGISYVVPVTLERNRLFSGSTPVAPGLIYASIDCAPLQFLESLVHEASHQLFYQLHSIDPLYRVDPNWTVWSPFIRRQRTVDGILLGTHAFANVIQFYRAVAIQFEQLGQCCSDQIAKIHGDVRLCIESLLSCHCLTPMGVRFVDRLNEIIRKV